MLAFEIVRVRLLQVTGVLLTAAILVGIVVLQLHLLRSNAPRSVLDVVIESELLAMLAALIISRAPCVHRPSRVRIYGWSSMVC